MKLNKESGNAEGEYFYAQAELCQQYIINMLQLEESEEFMDAKKYLVGFDQKLRRLWQP